MQNKSFIIDYTKYLESVKYAPKTVKIYSLNLEEEINELINSDDIDLKKLNVFEVDELKKISSIFDDKLFNGIASFRQFLNMKLKTTFNNSKLINLFNYLIENRRHERFDWFVRYNETIEKVHSVIRNLKTTKDLYNNETYKGTIFEHSQNPTTDFLSLLIYNRDNGIASARASNLSRTNFFEEEGLFSKNKKFLEAVTNCLVEPNNEHYLRLRKEWEEQKNIKGGVVFNEALCNRVLSAADVNISSTVTGSMFAQVADYFEKNYIQPYEGAEVNWFLRNQHLMEEVQKQLLQINQERQTELERKLWLNIFVWEAYEFISKPFDLKRQVIKYGAPGTGKTYSARKETRLQFNIWKEQYNPGYTKSFEEHLDIVQFHPSFSYEDFLEGLRPIPNTIGGVDLKLCNGVFKEFCRKASVWEVDLYTTFGDDIPFHSYTLGDFLENEKGALLAELEHWAHVKNIEDQSTLFVDVIPPFFFIIDEINRAELSRVLGELMFSLENRGVAGRIKTQYAQLNNEDTQLLAGGEFFIPQNVFIIGTMNTIDRSVESFDFALRRRFYWEKVMPEPSVVYYEYTNTNGVQWKDMIESWERLNERIKNHALLGEDYQIGHSYLLNLPYPTDTEAGFVKDKIWERTIAPLLEEYLRGTGNDIKEFKDAYYKGE